MNLEGFAMASSCDAHAALNDANEFEGAPVGEFKLEMTERHFSAMQPLAHEIARICVKFFQVSIC